ncbi:cAMP-dependent protein kinase catalytic subunit gamma-like [Galendromus occidentalis]|uniref:cAMP-dependent protein kinase catalytic subunit gamma-like n=1 Tax=Galendromus occidentalis TaxID=34638 RepID=A0AAJ6QYE7_9ACAR|nr:cAMP-dependent protein kinase catalytic subunit gamma-like [Galendromus occidentalis]
MRLTRGAAAKRIEDYENEILHADTVFRAEYEANACPRISYREFNLICLIGQGGFGRVYRGIRMENGIEKAYAVKIQVKDYLREGNRLQRAINEKKIHYALRRSRFIVKLFWTCRALSKIYMITEYAQHGDLGQICRTGPLKETTAKEVLGQVVMGIEYIHACNVIHRDLKLANILIFGRGHAKITDFGLAIRGSDDMLRRAGTPGFIAPELLKEEYSLVTEAADWWSLGVVMFMILLGSHPFYEGELNDDRGINEAVRRNQLRDMGMVTPAARAMIIQFLEENPERRLGVTRARVSDVQKHPWFSPDVDFSRFLSDDFEIPQDFEKDPPVHPVTPSAHEFSGEDDGAEAEFNDF